MKRAWILAAVMIAVATPVYADGDWVLQVFKVGGSDHLAVQIQKTFATEVDCNEYKAKLNQAAQLIGDPVFLAVSYSGGRFKLTDLDCRKP